MTIPTAPRTLASLRPTLTQPSLMRSLRLAPTVGLLLCVMAIATLTGCVMAQTSDGTSIDAAKAGQIKAGISTRADVTRLLGPPDEITFSNKALDPLFEKVYQYKRNKRRQTATFLILFSMFRSDTKWDLVSVFFDENGIVEHVGVQLDAENASYGTPFKE